MKATRLPADPLTRDLRRASLAFALPLAVAALVRLAIDHRYWNGRFLTALLALPAYWVLQSALFRRAKPSSIRLSLLVNFFAINLGYAAIGFALNSAPGWRADDAIYRFECGLFGRDPQLWLGPLRSPWLSTVAELGYIGFVGYLIYLFLAEAFDLSPATGRLQLGLMGLYGAGFSGYLLLPAAGPAFHHPALLAPIPQSALSAYFNDWVIRCCSQVDVFPSLHAAVTCFALIWTARHHRVAFLILLLPAAALLLGTVYFRYHYFTDLLAGLPLGAGFGLACSRKTDHGDFPPIISSLPP